MCRRTEEEVEPMVGLPRHRHFVGFFNVPVQTPTRDPPFYGYSEKPPHISRLLRHAWGYGGHILDLTPPRVPTGVFLLKLLLVGIKTAMHTKCRYAEVEINTGPVACGQWICFGASEICYPLARLACKILKPNF